ncbi:MAG: hypothetical protein QOJ29_3036 [Thermoleophilaceae bacterium]|nr:hypothetical protein [Thermoleophilaceae bacterium]
MFGLPVDPRDPNFATLSIASRFPNREDRLMDFTAEFAPADREDLVLASFACPTCLHSVSEALMNLDDEGSTVVCRCEPCQSIWAVGLTADQSLRLALSPPAALGLRTIY